MRLSTCFWMAAAAVVIFVSCQSETPDLAPAGGEKSISITISNVAKAPATRGSDSAFSVEGTPVADRSSLSVLFANEDGVVVDIKNFADAIATPDLDLDPDLDPDPAEGEAPGAADKKVEYIFHQVDARAKQLAVTNIAAVVGNDIDLLSAAQNTLATQQSDLADVLVWGRSGTFTESTETHDHAGITYKLWHAGEVEVIPALARIEIGNIEALDLNGSTAYANGLYPRFSTIALARIGIDNTKTGTLADTALAAYTTETEWNTAVAAAPWNIDAINNGTAITLDGTGAEGAITKYSGEVFVYNIAPGSVPNIMIEVTGGTWNPNAGPAATLDFPYFVKSTGLSVGNVPLTAAQIEAGSIVQVERFAFQCKDVKKLGEDDTLICVDVTVYIPDWVVLDDVEADFD